MLLTSSGAWGQSLGGRGRIDIAMVAGAGAKMRGRAAYGGARSSIRLALSALRLLSTPPAAAIASAHFLRVVVYMKSVKAEPDTVGGR